MSSPATTTGPARASTDSPSVEALQGQLQDLRHAIAFAIPVLSRVHDDPCKPAQRVLLGEAIADLRAALTQERP